MAHEATSWGRWPKQKHAAIITIPHRFAALPSLAPPLLPYGNGRSYGDVCLNKDGVLLAARRLDRFIAFDSNLGILECESGVLLSEIIELVLPSGWFPAVTPGTAYVTVGGAIANDVHGKNHHRAGCFSRHLIEFDLHRSDESTITCSLTQNTSWFEATIGGLGLTGLISRAKIQLRRIRGPWLCGESQRFARLRDFFELSKESDTDYEYTVAWVDCAASHRSLGRGIFMRGNHVPSNSNAPRAGNLNVPLTPPISIINRFTLRLFNSMYFNRSAAQHEDALWHYTKFLYPLDGIQNWNRIYGPNGFLQYQCVVPNAVAEAALHEMLQRISRSGGGSFLAVLKQFGESPSSGMLSFARPGTTLALDFANRGSSTLRLLDSLDEITRCAGGAVYPAKDARMSAESFQLYFPKWRQFSEFIDPQFSSSFWRRVTESEK